jgi:outer membrane immunogenic protein
MRKFLLATSAVVAVVVAAPAGAADLSVKAPIFRPMAPACAQFGGFYIGGFVGGAFYDHRWNDRDAWTSENDDDLHRSNVNAQKSGFIGGVQGGYNWQTNCTVFGIQVDYGWSSIDANVLETDADTGAALDTLTVSSRLRGLGTVRARTGVVVDNLMLYVTGGLAFANFRRSATQTDVGLGVSEIFASNKTKWGWTLGVGTEWQVWGNWSIQSEVLYAHFEKDETTFLCVAAFTCGAPGELKRFDHHDSVWVTKIGLNYRFGGAPVRAAY